jgi:hypothetical protein
MSKKSLLVKKNHTVGGKVNQPNQKDKVSLTVTKNGTKGSKIASKAESEDDSFDEKPQQEYSDVERDFIAQ